MCIEKDENIMAKIIKEARTLTIALLLGHARVIDNYLVLKHNDKEYLNHIRILLKKYNINTSEVVDFQDKNQQLKHSTFEDFAVDEHELELMRNNDFTQFPRYAIRTYKHTFLSVYRKMTYGGKLRRRWFNRFTSLHLAILYMEIGSLIYKKDNGKITTVNLILKTKTTPEYNQVLIEYLKDEWKLDFYQKKYYGKYIVCCGLNTAKEFIRIIGRYICPSMEYKINLDKTDLPEIENNMEFDNVLEDANLPDTVIDGTIVINTY